MVLSVERETGSRYLVFDVAMAADLPQVVKGPPHKDDEETPEERHHGWGEESPPHALTIVVTGYVWRERDDQVHLRYRDRRVRFFIQIDIITHSIAAAIGTIAICHS